VISIATNTLSGGEMGKTDILIDKLIKDENCEITRSNLLNIQVCSRLSEEETLEWLREKSPAGTSGNWLIQDRNSKDYLAPVQCANDQNRKHFIFVC